MNNPQSRLKQWKAAGGNQKALGGRMMSEWKTLYEYETDTGEIFKIEQWDKGKLVITISYAYDYDASIEMETPQAKAITNALRNWLEESKF